MKTIRGIPGLLIVLLLAFSAFASELPPARNGYEPGAFQTPAVAAAATAPSLLTNTPKTLQFPPPTTPPTGEIRGRLNAFYFQRPKKPDRNSAENYKSPDRVNYNLKPEIIRVI